MAKKAHLETIEDITEHCNEKCILKALAIRCWDDRFLEQIKCIGLYMDDMQEKDKTTYTWTEMTHKWNEEGYADKFSKVYEKYKDNLKAHELYNLIIGRGPLDNGDD